MLPIGNIQLGKTSKRSGYYPISAKASVCLLSLVCSSALYSTPAHAVDPNTLPQNGQVVGGDASFDYSTASELHVQQNTDRVVINWDSFNIGQNALTEFHQPNSSSLAVNRVTGVGQDSTQILGMLKANGNVMVLDRNGVLFGQNSTVDVGGLIVTTGEIDTNAVMAGGSALEITNIGTDAQIINEGQINISNAGLAAFVAPQVINNGIIQAKTGRVQIGAANSATIDLYGDGLLELAVDDGLENALIENNGQIIADGGTVHISAMAAKDIVDNIINVDGVITVSSATQIGGKIILEGANTHVSGSLHADGATGGGEIYVGGGLKGQGPIRHADKVTLTTDATITANATDNGDGGQIIVWSDSNTDAAGVFEAKGGAQGGDGGFIETSSKGHLHVEENTIVDISAPMGDGGEWLLDPEDILIADVGGDVSTATINGTLNGGGDVTITTAAGPAGSGNITLSVANIDKSTTNSDATLTLQAINDIIMNSSSINSSSADALNVVFNSDFDADQAGQITITNSTITTNGGYFVAGGGSGGVIDSDGNGILGDAGTGADFVSTYGNSTRNDGVYLGNTTINTGAGDLVITGHGQDLVGGALMVGVYIGDGSGTKLQTTSGDIIVRGTGGDGNDNNYGVYARNTGTEISSATGNIEITGTGGTDINADSNNNFGVYIADAAAVESTGTGAGVGTITITGTGADSLSNGRGVRIDGNNTRVGSIDGNISITGTGGSAGASTSNQSYGVGISGRTTIESTGTGVNAATITIMGTAGDGEDTNAGVRINADGTNITSIDGDISITGTGGSNGTTGSGANYGVLINGSADIVSTGTGANAATITVDGTAGDGESSNRGVHIDGSGTLITSVDGAIDITGQAGAGIATGDGNSGLTVENAARIVSTGTTANAATITLDGTGGATDDSNYGIRISGTNTEITSAYGAIDITGVGGSSGAAGSNVNYGIYVDNTADITSTGTGATAATITLHGTGGNGENQSDGILIEDSGTLITSIDGAIDITGIGGGFGVSSDGIALLNSAFVTSTGTGADAATVTLHGTSAGGTSDNRGVLIFTTSGITSVDGAIDITGVGGASTSNTNYALYLGNGSDIVSTGTGANAATITMSGTASATANANNDGIRIDGSGTSVSSIDGNIDLTGVGAGTGLGSTSDGVLVYNAAIVESTGTTADAATITIDGTGGNGTTENNGVTVSTNGAKITSAYGDIDITGQGGGSASQDSNRGIAINSSGVIESTGTGAGAATIRLDGTGGNGDDANNGVRIETINSRISTVDGDVTIIGQAGTNGLTDSITNHGVLVYNHATIETTGTGNLDITGTGESAGTSTNGVYIYNNGTVRSTSSAAGAGTISLNGTSADGTSNNNGVRVELASTVSSVNGNIDITGAARGSGASNEAFLLYNNSNITSTGDADIRIAGSFSGSGSGEDIRVLGGNNRIGGASANGDITLIGDIFLLESGTSIQTAQDVTVAPSTSSTTIGIGGGSGTLNLSDTELGYFDVGGTFTIGAAGTGTGAVDLNSWDLSSTAYDVELYGGLVDLGGVTMGTGSLLAYAQTDAYSALTMSGAITRNAAGTASVDLRAEGGIHLTAGDDITGTNGALNITLNSNRDNDTQGIINVTGVTLDSNGGDIILGGGTDPLNTAAQDFRGISLNTSTLTAGAGDISIRGKGRAGGTGNFWQGVVVVSTDISTTTGDITISGESQTTGTDSPGFHLQSSTIETDSGNISLTGTALNNAANNYGIRFLNGDIIINGSGDLTLTGQSQIDDFYANSASTIGGATTTGNFTFNVDDIRLDGGAIETDGNITIKPRTATTTIGLGGGAGDLNLDDSELALLDVGGTLTIGDSAAGTGDLDLDSWDLSSTTHDTEIYGGDIDLGGITMGGGSLLAHARDGGDVADLTVSADITRSVDGTATLDLRADQNVIVNNAITANDANSDADGTPLTSADSLTIVLNSDRDNDDTGAVSVQGAVTTLGGDLTIGGGTTPTSDHAVASQDGVFDAGVDIGATVNVGDGNISIYGKGENTGTNNYGIYIDRDMTTSGAGTITMNGIGGAGTNSNTGIYISGGGIEITAENGNQLYTAQGGGDGTGQWNRGFYSNGGADLVSTGSGNITVYGTGGLGTGSSQIGITSNNSTARITSVSGDILLDGTGTGSASGVTIPALLSTTGSGVNAGDITVNSNNNLHIGFATIQTQDGNITTNGTSHSFHSGKIKSLGNGNIDLNNQGNMSFANTTTNEISTVGGDIDITTNSYSLAGSAIIPVTAGGDIIIKPFTTDRTIGLGGGTGDLNLDDTELGYINAGGTLTIGDSAAGTGDIDINSWDLSATTHNTEIYGGDIDVGGITMGAGDLLIHARDGADASDITLSAAITRNQATDAVLDLRADQNIVANAGGDITESGAGTLDIIINADRDADQDGSIKLSGVTFTSNNGDITLGGGVAPSTTAAWGTSGVDDDGADIDNTDLISGTGDIRITGHGDDSSGSWNMGIVLSNGSTLQTTTGSITLNGTGGNGTVDNSGINIANASLIQSTAGGVISLTGVGQGSGDRNYGVYLQDGSDIIANGSATLSVSGTGSNGSSSNHGVFFEDSGTTVTNTLGAIDIDGSAQNGAAVYVYNGAVVESLNTSAADMTIDGNSSGGSGVNVSNANAAIRTNGANMIINAISTGSSDGLRMIGTGSTSNKPRISTAGAGNLTITATSSTGTGLFMNEFATLSSGGTGDFTLNASGNRAIYTRRADILANDGDLNITATASGLESWYTDKQVDIRTNNGDLNFTGNRQIRFINGSALQATNGDLTITASDIQVTGGTPTIRAGNILSVKPYDVNSTIGLGGGSGTLNLSSSELLNNFYASTFIIGDSTNGAGAVDINPVDLSAESFDLEVYGGSIIADGLDAANSLLLVANGGGAITLDGAISATGAGNSVVLVADSFTNNAGAAAIDAGTGRFLVYADQFSDVTDGGLVAGNLYGTTYAGTPPASVVPTGSRFVFQEQPTLTFTANNATQTGSTPAGFTYNTSGLRGGDTLGDAISGAPAFTQGASLGGNTFSIDGATGTATSLLGYLFNFAPGVLTVNNTAISDNSLDHQQVQILTNTDTSLENQGDIDISPFDQTLDSIIEIIYEDSPLSQEEFNTIKPSGGETLEENTLSSNGQGGCLVTDGASGGCSSGQS